MYRVFESLDALVTVVEEARGVPMTSNCVVPRGDVLELLDDIREALPGELDDAQDVLDRRDEIVAPYPNVKVDSFDGLLVDYCRAHDVRAIVKGLRAVTDFDYELQMAQMNQQLSGVDTLFMSTSPEWSFVASSLVKEIATYGGDIAHLLPPTVHRRLMERIAERA